MTSWVPSWSWARSEPFVAMAKTVSDSMSGTPLGVTVGDQGRCITSTSGRYLRCTKRQAAQTHTIGRCARVHP